MPQVQTIRRQRARGTRSLSWRAARCALVAVARAAAVLAGCCAPSSALAEPPQAASPTITPPRLDPPPEVLYPDGAEGDAEVVLVLVIGADGAVRSASVERGEEPFASVAQRAASTWVFSPATRDGAPIASKIRFAVTFRAPRPAPLAEPADAPPTPPGATPATPGAAKEKAPTAASAPEPPTTTAAAAAAPAAPAALEVTILGDRPAPTVKTMTRAEVRALPGAFGDPFRAIEAMPGVTPILSGLPYFYVRGAPPGNVGYYLDGVRIPYLFHVAAGPSVVHPSLTERVDLYSGGYPARYGRFAGAIVSADTTLPTFDWHGEANLRLVDVGGLVEGTFGGGRGSVLVGGRYSYTAAVISLISPDIRVDYRDFQARAAYRVSGQSTLSVFAFGSYDLLAQEQNGIETILFGSEFYRVDARYDAALPGDGSLRWAATWGFDQTRVADQRNARDVLAGTRAELKQPLGRDVVLRAGLNVEFDSYKADSSPYGDPEDPDVIAYNNLFPSRTDSVASTYAELLWRVDPRMEISPGIRLDLFHSGSATALGVDPRLSTRVELAKGVAVVTALGVAHQPPSYIVPIPGVAVGSLQGGLQRSIQSSVGVELDLPLRISATISGFNNVFLNMSDTAGVRPPGDAQNQVPRSLGASRGLEVYIRRNLTQHLGGYISYTLSRSTRALGAYEFPFAFDRTHVLNTALSYEIGRGWRAGGRFTFYTGVPDLSPPGTVSELARVTNPPRQPSFYRVDVRVEKKWQLTPTRWIAFVVEALNATLNKEFISNREIGPVTIPSIGVEGGL